MREGKVVLFIRNYLMIAIIVFLSIAFYKLIDLRNGMGTTGAVSLYWEEPILTQEKIMELMEDETIGITARGYGEKVTIGTTVLGIQVKGEVILVGGETKDVKGCIITKELAENLFKATEVVGETLKANKIDYRISKVVEESGKYMYLLGEKNTTYSNLMVMLEDINPKDRIEKLIQQYHLPYPDLLIISEELSFFLQLFSSIPLLSIFIVSLTQGMGYAKRQLGSSMIHKWVGYIVIIVGSIIFMSILFTLDIPQSLIPTKWSDTNFYRDTAIRLVNNGAIFLSMKKLPELIIVEKLFIQSILWLIGWFGGLGLLMGIKSQRR